MKRFLAAAGCALLLCSPLRATAAGAPALTVNGVDYTAQAMATLCGDTTYVSLRVLSGALDRDSIVSWEENVAWVQAEDLLVAAKPGRDAILINGEMIPVPLGVKLTHGRTLVPVRTLAQAFGASVQWNPVTGAVSVTTEAPDVSYSDGDLYWLSRIISAESQGEPLEGKIAVGNVVLNRVASPEFPNTIYDVIFDSRWGGQFEPVRNGTIYQTPTQESVLAAQLCLEGTNVAGRSLYFLDPSVAQNLWTTRNRTYVTAIGRHAFYA